MPATVKVEDLPTGGLVLITPARSLLLSDAGSGYPKLVTVADVRTALLTGGVGFNSGDALVVGSGGTGLTGTPTNGQLLVGNGTGYSLATLTAGTNVSITNGSGSITINASVPGGAIGGTVSTGFIPIAASAGVLADSTLTLASGVLAGLSSLDVGSPDGPAAAIRLAAGTGISIGVVGGNANWIVRQSGSNELYWGTTFGGGVFTNRHRFYSGTDNSRYVDIEASQITGVGGVGALGTSGVPWHNIHANTITSYNRIDTKASVTGGAGLRIPHGTAPTSPIDGDFWSTSAGFYGRVSGTTVGPFGAGGGGGGDALTSNPLSQFAATTSAQLAGVISDETGTGALVFANSPTFTTPNIGSATGSISGNAGTATALATARTINGVSFDGTANITVTAAAETLSGSALPALSGASLTNLNASAIASGTVGTARLGSGTADSTTFLRGDGTWQAIGGGGDALTSSPLSQFAATTSAQLAGVISDETGTGALVFANTPTLVTPVLGVATATSINKVAITAPATSATLTIANGATLTCSATATVSGTNTGDQTTITGNAGTATALQTARTINGTSFDGTANITVTAAAGTLTGATLAAGVTASSLTSVGTLSALTMGGTLALVDNLLTRPYLQDYAEVVNAVGSISGATNISYAGGNHATATLTGNTTVTITNPPASGRSGTITLEVTGNGTATFAITNGDPGDQGAAGVIPNAEKYFFWLNTIDGGTSWRYSWAGGY